MSNSYRKEKTQKAFQHLADSSSDLIDYRSRLCYMSMVQKHPKWDKRAVRSIAETKALFITLFQPIIDWNSERRMRRILRRARRRANIKH